MAVINVPFLLMVWREIGLCVSRFPSCLVCLCAYSFFLFSFFLSFLFSQLFLFDVRVVRLVWHSQIDRFTVSQRKGEKRKEKAHTKHNNNTTTHPPHITSHTTNDPLTIHFILLSVHPPPSVCTFPLPPGLSDHSFPLLCLPPPPCA